MNETIEKNIKDIFIKNKGYAETKELCKNSINSYYINELEVKGKIERIKRGFYRLKGYDFKYNNEIVEVSQIVSSGVICLTSALSYYELTTYNPWRYEVAIDRDTNVVLPQYPPIKLFYFSKDIYEMGVSQFKIEGYNIKIYDIEKTICDCIRYRNKIGIEIVKESLHEYINRNDKDLNKLMIYAKKCRVYNVLKRYLEVLI